MNDNSFRVMVCDGLLETYLTIERQDAICYQQGYPTSTSVYILFVAIQIPID